MLHFAKIGQRVSSLKSVKYEIVSPEVYLDKDGAATISVRTHEPAESLVVDFNGKMIDGTSLDKKMWSVRISGLSSGSSYTIHIYPNKLFSHSEETIFIKKKGLVIDDDL